jgi:hypothetical protein
MRPRMVLALVVAAAAVVMPLLARANHVDVADGNDVRGLLDIKRVEMVGVRKPSFKVNTYGWWTTREVFERGFVLVFFDVRGTERSDYYALARSTGSRVVGTLHRDRPYKPDYRVSWLNAWRVGNRSISIKVPLRKMNFGSARVVYRWYAETLFTGNRCRRVCFDFAPNNETVTEPRPGATPSPTTSSG